MAWRIILLLTSLACAANVPAPSTDTPTTTTSTVEPVMTTWPASAPPLDTVTVVCSPDAMLITVKFADDEDAELDNYIYDRTRALFNGIVYPAGLGTNSSCLQEYRDADKELHYTLPLTACNTMSTDNDDGTVELFNNIVVQPHLHLVTGQGRGYRVRCRYRRRDLAHYRLHHRRPHADRLIGDPTLEEEDYEEDDDVLPIVTMKIFKGNPEDKQVAANVKIGEPLTLRVSLEPRSPTRYSLLVAECRVRDGLGAEQTLIADGGCSLDGEIMPMFAYSTDRREGHVTFFAHRFPYTASVYYTCEVRLCDASEQDDCEPCARQPRHKRQADEGAPATVEVFSGLYVDETDAETDPDVVLERNEDEICISQRNFAIGICVAGVILMLAVIAAIAIILARRRGKTYSRTGSSLYSGPYTNTGYSHTS